MRDRTWLLHALAAASLALLIIPLVGLLQRTPWSDLGGVLGAPESRDALRVSITVAVSATVLSTVLGVPLAWLLVHGTRTVRTIVRPLVLVPLVLPPVVGGTALLFALGRRGLFGQWLDEWFGIQLPFTTAGAVLAATFVALPFMTLAVESGLQSFPMEHEETALTLGASRGQAFLHVVLPGIRPQLLAGVGLAFARALGEFGATVTFAGNSPGRTRTLPLEIFVALEREPGAALVLSVGLLAVSVVLLAALHSQVWPNSPLRLGRRSDQPGVPPSVSTSSHGGRVDA